jgi:uncharacterized cupin superfamily protein
MATNGHRQTEDRKFLGTVMRIHVSQLGRDDGISLIEHIVPYGFSPPLHVHHDEDEIFHILSGTVRFLVDGKETTAGPGETLVAPHGRPHCFVVTSPEGARWLTVTNRGDFERMMRSASRPAETGERPDRLEKPTPAMKAALEAACRVNNIELVGPPMA